MAQKAKTEDSHEVEDADAIMKEIRMAGVQEFWGNREEKK